MYDDPIAARHELDNLVLYLHDQLQSNLEEISGDFPENIRMALKKYIENEAIPKLEQCLRFVSEDPAHQSCRQLREFLNEKNCNTEELFQAVKIISNHTEIKEKSLKNNSQESPFHLAESYAAPSPLLDNQQDTM